MHDFHISQCYYSLAWRKRLISNICDSQTAASIYMCDITCVIYMCDIYRWKDYYTVYGSRDSMFLLEVPSSRSKSRSNVGVTAHQARPTTVALPLVN